MSTIFNNYKQKLIKIDDFLYMIFAGFPGLCSCCPIKPPTLGTTVTSSASSSPTSLSDPRSSSVAELRRKAQEHSAALLQSLQAAAAAGLAFPGLHLPPLSLHSALHARKSDAMDLHMTTTSAATSMITSSSSSGGSIISHNNNNHKTHSHEQEPSGTLVNGVSSADKSD